MFKKRVTKRLFLTCTGRTAINLNTMKKIHILSISMMLLIFVTFAPEALSQIKVFSNGSVGINYTTSIPLSKLVLGTQGTTGYQAMFSNSAIATNGGTFYSYTAAGSSTSKNIFAILAASDLGTGNYQFGLKGTAYSATSYTVGRAYGVYGYAGGATTGYNYGVYGYVYGSNYGAGVFGTTSGDYAITTGKYAGFFYGNVKVTSEMWANVITTSDARMKTNIASMSSKQSIDKLKELNPVTYNLMQKENVSTKRMAVADTASVQKLYDEKSQFFQKPKYGLLAQDVQKVYPDLVYEDQEGNLGIDYTGLIPVLISAIQEQQKKIDALEDEIKSIRSKPEGNSAVLR